MRLRFAVAVLLLATSPARAIDPLESEFKFQDYTSGGRRIGCAMEYVATFPEKTYRKGSLSGVVGGFTWFSRNDESAVVGMLKVGAVDFDDKMVPTIFDVPIGSLKAAGQFQHPDQSIECETKSNYCGVYHGARALNVLNAMIEGPVEIGYARKLGSFDVMVKIPLPQEELVKLAGCMQELLKSAATKRKAQ